MTLADLMEHGDRIAPALRSRVPVLFLVGALPPDTAPGDKLAVTAVFDADGSLLIEVAHVG